MSSATSDRRGLKRVHDQSDIRLVASEGGVSQVHRTQDMHELVAQRHQGFQSDWESIKETSMQVLNQAQQFLDAGEIAHRAFSSGLIESGSKRVEVAVEAALMADIAQGRSPFARSDDGAFGLQEWLDQEETEPIAMDSNQQEGVRYVNRGFDMGLSYRVSQQSGQSIHTVPVNMKASGGDMKSHQPSSYEHNQSNWPPHPSSNSQRQPTAIPRSGGYVGQWMPNGSNSGSTHTPEEAMGSFQRPLRIPYQLPCQPQMYSGPGGVPYGYTTHQSRYMPYTRMYWSRPQLYTHYSQQRPTSRPWNGLSRPQIAGIGRGMMMHRQPFVKTNILNVPLPDFNISDGEHDMEDVEVAETQQLAGTSRQDLTPPDCDEDGLEAKYSPNGRGNDGSSQGNGMCHHRQNLGHTAKKGQPAPQKASRMVSSQMRGKHCRDPGMEIGGSDSDAGEASQRDELARGANVENSIPKVKLEDDIPEVKMECVMPIVDGTSRNIQPLQEATASPEDGRMAQNRRQSGRSVKSSGRQSRRSGKIQKLEPMGDEWQDGAYDDGDRYVKGDELSENHDHGNQEILMRLSNDHGDRGNLSGEPLSAQNGISTVAGQASISDGEFGHGLSNSQ